jgi:hypothetical protein
MSLPSARQLGCLAVTGSDTPRPVRRPQPSPRPSHQVSRPGAAMLGINCTQLIIGRCDTNRMSLALWKF